MCQLWGEFIEIYVKTDLWRESFQKVPSGDKGKAAQRNIVLKAERKFKDFLQRARYKQKNF